MDIYEKSYESLRNELLQWQNRRYIIFSSTLIFIAALLGWFISSDKDWNFYTASILPLLLIVGASFLTRNSTVYSVKIGTYFMVFYNDTWEISQGLFNKRANIIQTNQYFAVFYLFTSILSNVILFYETKVENLMQPICIFIAAWLFTLLAIYYVGIKSYPREKYLDIWREIKESQPLTKNKVHLEDNTKYENVSNK